MATLEKEDSIQLVGFHLGQKLYGTDILKVQEILREPPIETIDQSPGFIEGVVHLRGEPIPVINLRHRLGNPKESDSVERAWVMIANTGDITTGFMVDEVTRIIKITSDMILPAPDLILEGLRSPYIRGVCTTDVGMLVVLDFEGILAMDEISELKQLDVRPMAGGRRT